MSLVSKLAEVMKAVERVPKRGRNEFHKYDYATEADIAEAIRKELADRQVMLIPAIVNEQRHPVGEKGSVLTVLEMQMEFLDGESNERIVKPWRGYGTDKEDKGGYKAMTGGEKYFLLKTFLLPTGDDPEQETRENKAERRNRGQATVRPDRDIKQARKARGPLPAGTSYVEKVVPMSKGKIEWADIVLSTGEVVVAREPGAIALATNLAQEDAPVEVTTSRNGKGNLELVEIRRWKPNGAEPHAAPAQVAEVL